MTVYYKNMQSGTIDSKREWLKYLKYVKSSRLYSSVDRSAHIAECLIEVKECKSCGKWNETHEGRCVGCDKKRRPSPGNPFIKRPS